MKTGKRERLAFEMRSAFGTLGAGVLVEECRIKDLAAGPSIPLVAGNWAAF
jgi:hypothetical protein